MTQEIRNNWQYVHVRRVVNVSFYTNIEFCSGIHRVEEGRRHWDRREQTLEKRTGLNRTVSDTTTELLKVTS